MADDVVERARIKARNRIVFETPHGCNNDLADDIFAKTWRAAIAAIPPTPIGISELVDEPLERWADIQDDTDAIVKCGDRWKAVAASIGCSLYGFNDGSSASFITPDGNVIEVGPKFRSFLCSLRSQGGG